MSASSSPTDMRLPDDLHGLNLLAIARTESPARWQCIRCQQVTLRYAGSARAISANDWVRRTVEFHCDHCQRHIHVELVQTGNGYGVTAFDESMGHTFAPAPPAQPTHPPRSPIPEALERWAHYSPQLADGAHAGGCPYCGSGQLFVGYADHGGEPPGHFVLIRCRGCHAEIELLYNDDEHLYRSFASTTNETLYHDPVPLPVTVVNNHIQPVMEIGSHQPSGYVAQDNPFGVGYHPGRAILGIVDYTAGADLRGASGVLLNPSQFARALRQNSPLQFSSTGDPDVARLERVRVEPNPARPRIIMDQERPAREIDV